MQERLGGGQTRRVKAYSMPRLKHRIERTTKTMNLQVHSQVYRVEIQREKYVGEGLAELREGVKKGINLESFHSQKPTNSNLP